MPVSITRTYSPESIRRATRIELVDDQVSPRVRVRIAGDDFMPPFVGKGRSGFQLCELEIVFDSTKPGEQQRVKDAVTAILRRGDEPLKV